MEPMKNRLSGGGSPHQDHNIDPLCGHNHNQAQAQAHLSLHSQQHFASAQPPVPPSGKSLEFQPKGKLFGAEFLGTFLLVYLSQTAVASFELTGTQNDTINRQVGSALASGLALMFASALTIDLSGAHLNPAYTIASATFGKIRWQRTPAYLTGQYAGALLAAAILHATYSDKLGQRHAEGLLVGSNASMRAHGNLLSTGKFFSSYPPTEVSLPQLFVSYTLAAAHLMLLLVAVHEARPLRVGRTAKPAYLAGAIILVQLAFAANGGPVLNPAQDFAPRLYIALFGWGAAAFNLYHFRYWWICGLLAPHFGALIGFGLQRVLVHLTRTGAHATREATCCAGGQRNYKPVQPSENF